MKMRWLILAVATQIAAAGSCFAIDTIKTLKGASMPGRVVGMSPQKIDFEQGAPGSVPKEIPVNEIQTIFFEDEPAELKSAKQFVANDRYANAQAVLEKIEGPASRPEVQQDIEFYKALCAAKLALGGSGKIVDAGRAMKSFVDANSKNYHYYQASEIVGELLVAIRQYPQAVEYFNRLGEAPWPDYKMRAAVALGRALLAQGKLDEANAEFEKALGIEADGPSAQEQRTLAKLGKAGVLVAAKKPDDAVAIVNEVLKTNDPEDAVLMARAYNVLGTAQRQAGRTKEAILAFLHIDILYPNVPAAHAEALANLADLWEEVHKTERANRARETLEENYPDSSWAKKEGSK